MEELQEQLKRYVRLVENEDFIKTMAEMREAYQIDGSIFLALNCTHPNEHMWAREGIRTFLNKLDKLVDETKDAIKYNVEKGENNDE